MKLPAALLSLLAVILLPMLQQEFMNACPRLSRGLLRLASRAIPATHRARYLEEWLAELEELEGLQLTMLATAARILLFAPTTGWALRGSLGLQPAPAPPAGGSLPRNRPLTWRPSSASQPRVLAVVVNHNGRPFLRKTFGSLARQTRPVDDVVVVDLGSVDGSDRWAQSRLGGDAVIQVNGTYGEAVMSMALDEKRAGAIDWLWLLHADSAPEPDALERLLEEVTGRTGVCVAGPKLVDWNQPDRLLEVGWSVDRTGRAISPIDQDEVLDQGQHDQVRDVFFVSTPGMLVHRGALLGSDGFDQRMLGGREDLDLCWRLHLLGGRVLVVPAARVLHAGRRPHSHGTPGPDYLVERDTVAAMLKATTPRRLPLVLLLALGGALNRALALAVTGRPRGALQVLGAWGWNAKQLPATLAHRRRLQARRKINDAALRPLRAPGTYRLHRAAVRLLECRDRLIGDPGSRKPYRASFWEPPP
jgi:GT2 family glycosyltransferase